MNNGISERDWRIFRELHAVAEERLCQRILESLRRELDQPGESARIRYRELLGYIQEQNGELSRGFDDLSRSTALAQVGVIHSMGLWTGAELRRFSPETLQYAEAYGPIPAE
jgi:hypothetical protein